MLEKLKSISDRYDKLTELLSDQATLADMNEFKKLSKERADMEETVQKYQEYKKVEKERSDAEELIKSETDQEMKELLFAF